MSLDLQRITRVLTASYGITDPLCKDLHTPTNDVVEVASAQGHFALKLYQAITNEEIEWEIELILHLLAKNVPVVRPVLGKDGYLSTFALGDKELTGVLFEWAEGEKPQDTAETYRLIGAAAAQIHAAADTFDSSLAHTNYNADLLINEQIERMRPLLVESGRLQNVTELMRRLQDVISNPSLDYGICHMDLKPDNVHIHNGQLTVFDFNSSGESWRAIEPYRILKKSDVYFRAWLEGYRSVRVFSVADEKAVAAFTIIGDIRSIVWDLGLARSSRGTPLLGASDLPKIVDKWLEWEGKMIPRT